MSVQVEIASKIKLMKRWRFLLILITITLFAITAVFALVLFNYRFINRLAETVSKDLNLEDGEEYNEQILLSNAFLTLMEKTQITKQKLFLTNLLAGQYDETTIESAVNEYNMTFEYENYIACVLYFHGNLEKGLTNSIMLYLKEYFDRNDM